MSIFNVLSLLGGLALFLYGMNTMSDSLSKLSGGRLEGLLRKLTSNRFKGVILGLVVTAIIQSSSATTVMVVGFVNSGIMQLGQAVGIIMGANIGTTVTSWLLSLTGISGSSIWIKLLKPSSFTPVLAAIGILLLMTAKGSSKKKNIGNILLGFAVLMFGMEAMSSAVAPLSGNETFTSILTMFSNPILGMAAGALLTAVIQSSSASVGILQALCATGAVGFSSAIPIIMGQNIGTCVTAIISSVGASKNAKRASMVHLYFNLIGTIIFMAGFYGLNCIFKFDFLNTPANAAGIAVIHSLFNIGSVIILFPFGNGIVKLSQLTIRDKRTGSSNDLPKELAALDERFLDNTGLAVGLSKDAAYKMAMETKECLFMALDILGNYSNELYEKVVAKEQLLDTFEDTIGTYLVRLSGKELTNDDSRVLSVLLHCTSDMERISDHALNLAQLAANNYESGGRFSEEAFDELSVLIRAVHDIMQKTADVFVNRDIKGAGEIEPLEEVIDGLNIILRQNHIRRLKEKNCTIELGIAFEDIIVNLERVSDHCSNIAVCMIQVQEEGFDTHKYIDTNIKHTKEFADEVLRLENIYKIS